MKISNFAFASSWNKRSWRFFFYFIWFKF